jgi:hypothetical protein
MNPRVVLDTNIYIRALLNPKGGAMRLVWLARQGYFQLFTSRGQLAELVEVVLRDFGNPKGKRYISEESLSNLVAVILKSAKVIPTARMHKVSPDPDDDFIIGIAVKAKASYLITENVKDIFQAIMPQHPPIEVLDSTQAMKRLSLAAKPISTKNQ